MLVPGSFVALVVVVVVGTLVPRGENVKLWADVNVSNPNRKQKRYVKIMTATN